MGLYARPYTMSTGMSMRVSLQSKAAAVAQQLQALKPVLEADTDNFQAALRHAHAHAALELWRSAAKHAEHACKIRACMEG